MQKTKTERATTGQHRLTLLEDQFSGQREKRTYPWTFLSINRALVTSMGICLFLLTGSFLFSRWYVSVSHDTDPSGLVGLIFAFAALSSFLLAAGGYSLRRRQPYRRAIGQLNAILQWHVVFALLSLGFAALHSFGHTTMPSGTFSLYSLCLLVISGWIGRLLDRILPRLIAGEVYTVCSKLGDDALTPATSQLSQGQRLPRTVLQTIVQGEVEALRREQTYRLILRLWRKIHLGLALLTIGLVSWHLTFAIRVMFFNK